MKNSCIALALAATTLFAACKKDNEGPEVATYHLPANATAQWRGYLATGYFNEGTIAVESNNLQMTDGRITGGTFRMPLTSLHNLNLPADSLKEMLVHHLQSADFFNMALHPDLSFTISQVENKAAGAADSTNVWVSGELSLLGKALPIRFPATVRSAGNELMIAASLKVDRSRWGMTYASDASLPDEARILNDISIDLRLTAQEN